MEQVKPETYSLDLIGGNGTPFRFVYWPSTDTVSYQDRRYPSKPDEPQYRPFMHDENGQNCGPTLTYTDFVPLSDSGMRGWNEIDAWDIDRSTMRRVGMWLETLKEYSA